MELVSTHHNSFIVHSHAVIDEDVSFLQFRLRGYPEFTSESPAPLDHGSKDQKAAARDVIKVVHSLR